LRRRAARSGGNEAARRRCFATAYHDAGVGNVIISDHTAESSAADSPAAAIRQYSHRRRFYHNLSSRVADQAGGPWRSTCCYAGQTEVELRDNVFWHAVQRSSSAMARHAAFADNWISRGWQLGHGFASDVVMMKTGRLIEGDAPAFGAGCSHGRFTF
jgi:hypothetical protein